MAHLDSSYMSIMLRIARSALAKIRPSYSLVRFVSQGPSLGRWKGLNFPAEMSRSLAQSTMFSPPGSTAGSARMSASWRSGEVVSSVSLLSRMPASNLSELVIHRL
ncbi:hypothetical protein A6A27_31865 [Micromonospora sp. CB01531]|nr:hypothetical protein A6A27_31865 [Micromonospora sp. CB01531]